MKNHFATETSLADQVPMIDLRVFEAMPGNSILVNLNPPQFTILAVTEGMINRSGLSKEELIDRPFFDPFPANTSNPQDPNDMGQNMMLQSFEYVIKNKKAHQLPILRYDLQNEEGDFTEFYWSVRNKPVLDKERNVLYILHTSEDITEKVKAEGREKKIRTIEKEHKLFMQAPVAIQILKGPELIIELANEPTFAIWGKGKDIVGRPLKEVLPELNEQGYVDLLHRVRDNGQVYEAYELSITLLIGGKEEIKYFNTVCQPYYEEDKKKAIGVLTYTSDVTDKVAAKKVLEEKEEENTKLAAIMQASQEFIGLAASDTSIVYINPAGLKMLGWDSIEGKHIIDCIYPADRTAAQKLLEQLIKNGPFSQEIRFNNEKSGEPFWLLWNVFTIENPASGELIGLATVSTNITERKKIDKALRESHERFEAAIEAIQGILWTNSAEGQMLGEQKGWALLTGQAYEDYQEYGWANAVHPEDAQPTVDAWNVAVRERKTFIFEHRVKKKDGTWGLFSVRTIPLLNDDGSIREWVGVHTDITEHRIAEQNIRESEERFRKLADDSPIFIFIIEPTAEAPVSYWNKTWLEYTGQSMEEALGRAWDDVIHPDDITIVMDNYVPAFQKRQSYFVPCVRVKRNDGTYRWHAFKGNPRYLPNGEFNGYVGVGFDIHEQKLNEELIKQSETQLQLKVAERTHELQRTIEELKRSNTNLEEFAYAASHDLKAPIRKINIFGNVLNESLQARLTGEEKQLFSRMEAAAKRMGVLIEDLLTYSQVNLTPSTFEKVDLNELIDLVLEDLDLEIEEKRATIKVNKLFTIRGHHRQLQQAFQNLISNSLKYVKADLPPHITISYNSEAGSKINANLSVQERDKIFDVVSITDNGIGFDQNDAERIFNVFTRLHSNTEFEGTGIGLSIVRKVIINHNGYIAAESVPGEGTTFRIYLQKE